MKLTYHQATYDLLTQHPLSPDKVIQRRFEMEIAHAPPDMREKLAQQRDHMLAWTKLELFQRPVQFSVSNIQKLDDLEQKYRVKIPAAIREWYSLDIAPEIMSIRDSGFTDIPEFMPLVDMDFSQWENPRPDLWFFLWDEYIEQGGEAIAFKINAGDNPPIFALLEDSVVVAAPSFTEFLHMHFWDWYTYHTFAFKLHLTHSTTIEWLQIPVEYHVPIERIRQHYTQLPNSRGLRFYDAHTRILGNYYERPTYEGETLPEFDTLTAAAFCTDNLDAVQRLLICLWGDDAPIFHFISYEPEVKRLLDELRRAKLQAVLQKAGDWIDAPTLAYQLGNSIPSLNWQMVNQLDALISAGLVEDHPDNLPHAKAQHRFRAKR